jgi:COP9 signalosome complex subunit 2
LQVKNAAPSSLVNAVIKEAGGKVEAKSGSWNSAFRSFYDAFHSYDEAGQIRRLLCLKYTALANMMMLSNINPFESPETRPYKEVPEIAPMVALVTAYQQRDIDGFFRMLETQRAQIFDEFMAEFIPQLVVNIRTQLLIKMLQPYTTVRIPFLAQVRRRLRPCFCVGVG